MNLFKLSSAKLELLTGNMELEASEKVKKTKDEKRLNEIASHIGTSIGISGQCAGRGSIDEWRN